MISWVGSVEGASFDLNADARRFIDHRGSVGLLQRSSDDRIEFR